VIPLVSALLIIGVGYVVYRMDWKWFFFKPGPPTKPDPRYDIKRDEL
jgi:hypothetical protein